MKAKQMTFTITVVLAALILGQCSTVKGAPDTTLQDEQCDAGTYTIGDNYDNTVFYTLHELWKYTASSPGMDRRNQYRIVGDDRTVYGHGSCSTDSVADCDSCMQSAYSTIVQYCAGKVGGLVFLTDCSIRYANYYFNDK